MSIANSSILVTLNTISTSLSILNLHQFRIKFVCLKTHPFLLTQLLTSRNFMPIDKQTTWRLTSGPVKAMYNRFQKCLKNKHIKNKDHKLRLMEKSSKEEGSLRQTTQIKLCIKYQSLYHPSLNTQVIGCF